MQRWRILFNLSLFVVIQFFCLFLFLFSFFFISDIQFWSWVFALWRLPGTFRCKETQQPKTHLYCQNKTHHSVLQLAKMKKYIKNSLLCHRNRISRKEAVGLRKFCYTFDLFLQRVYVEFGAISWTIEILSITAYQTWNKNKLQIMWRIWLWINQPHFVSTKSICSLIQMSFSYFAFFLFLL